MRRSKAFWVSEQQVFDLFVHFANSPNGYVDTPTPIGLPEGAFVDYVRHDPSRRGFAFIVSHPSFPVWADGAICPQDDDKLELTVRRRRLVEENYAPVEAADWKSDALSRNILPPTHAAREQYEAASIKDADHKAAEMAFFKGTI